MSAAGRKKLTIRSIAWVAVAALVVGGWVLLAAPPLAAQAAPLDFDLPGADGARLRATYYSPGRPGPGVLLLHQCNSDRRIWASLAHALVARGLHVLTFDHRGHGESPGGSRDAREWGSDIDRAAQYLSSQPGVDRGRIAAGGASCGVNNAVSLVQRTESIRVLMLLSGPIEESSQRYLRRHPEVAIFGAGDVMEGAMALSDIRAVVATSRHSASTITSLRDVGHGAEMFAADTTLLRSAADWLARVLR